MRPEEFLICRIFEQAIEDYKNLKDEGIVLKKAYSSGSYSIKDIEHFFNSSWCERLLEMIGCNLTGKDVLNRVKTQCA